MTTAYTESSSETNACRRPGFKGLRLISSRGNTEQTSTTPADLPARPCLVLKSAFINKNIVNERELLDLFGSLRLGERLEFCHSVHRDDFGNAPADQPYRLRIRVAGPDSNIEELKERVHTVVASSFPDFHFVSGGTLAPASLRHTAQFALAGMIATEKPAPHRFAEDCTENAKLTRMLDAGRKAQRQTLPFPEDLPSWAFSTPFTDPLILPRATEICIRVQSFTLDPEKCETLQRTLFRIHAGNLVVFHPDSPVAEYSVATQMQESTGNLLRHWLQHPRGFVVDCVVRSSEALSDAAQKRVVSDVFGKRPFTRVRAFDDSQPQELASPEFAWAIAAGQGLPALMPAQSVLATLAVPRHYVAPSATPPSTGAWIGSTACGRRSSAVCLPFESRTRHVAVVGSTGSGKSSLFTQMMAADIADPQRRCGIGLIDPHGSLYERVLELVPANRIDDVILVDTADVLNTACINPLEGMNDDPLHANFIVSELMSLIDLLLEGQDTSGPMTRSNLRNLLLLTAGTPRRHPCILDAVRILEDKDYAEYLLSKSKDRNVVEYWRNFMKTTSSSTGYTEWAPYMMARLTPFVASPIMKRLINRPDSTIDLSQAMQDKKIVLFNLNKGVLNEVECRVLGSLILSKFFAAALGRASLPEAQRTQFHLYVDEFATFANDATPRLFSEARKFGLCLNVAFQSLSQLEKRWGRSNIATSVLANTGSKFIMRLGPADVSTMEPYFQPQFDAPEMTSLPDFHAVACMADDNRPLPPFVLKVNLAKPDAATHVPVKELQQRSMDRYTVPVEQANRELAKLFELDISTLQGKAKLKPLEPTPMASTPVAP